MSKTERREAIAVVNALVRAHNKLARKGGWTQGYYSLPEKADCFCAAGALRSACGGHRDDHGYVMPPVYNHGGVACVTGTYRSSWRLLVGAVAEEVGGGLETVMGYNDAKGRTKRDVLAVYKMAIAAARKAVPVRT